MIDGEVMREREGRGLSDLGGKKGMEETRETRPSYIWFECCTCLVGGLCTLITLLVTLTTEHI